MKFRVSCHVKNYLSRRSWSCTAHYCEPASTVTSRLHLKRWLNALFADVFKMDSWLLGLLACAQHCCIVSDLLFCLQAHWDYCFSKIQFVKCAEYPRGCSRHPSRKTSFGLIDSIFPVQHILRKDVRFILDTCHLTLSYHCEKIAFKMYDNALRMDTFLFSFLRKLSSC